MTIMKMDTLDHLLHFPPSGRGVRTVKTDNLGSILVGEGKLTPGEAEQIMELQQREGWRFGEAALRLSLISERDLTEALHKQYDLPSIYPGDEGVSEELVSAYQQHHPRTEELRALRTQLLIRWYRQAAPDQRVLAITSPGNGEGRSYVAANLAVLFAQMGERTLLIDGDLRNPRQHKIFNIPDRIGLSTVLAGRAEPTAACAIPGFLNLMVLPAGGPPPNPLELLSRPILPALLEDYLADFDIVLMDTPPALQYSDAQAIGFRAGSAIVIARRDHTRVSDTTRVARDLGNSGTRVVGTVINVH